MVTTYDGLKELLHAFATGLISLLAIVARPGLGKSQLVQQAVRNQAELIIKLRKSALDFYIDLYAAKDLPVILDDADNLISQPLCREYVKALTETDKYKKLSYGTKTKILEDERVPKFFFTTSPVCLIANYWNSRDAIFQALESRAEFIYFDPDWSEVYREVGGWFWDQEIYDYVRDRLGNLKEPDMRLFVKAYNRKKAGLSTMDWCKLIDDYVDDALGLEVRRLMDDLSFKSNTDRAQAFTDRTKADRATFYRRLAQIRRYRPLTRPDRIFLANTAPPISPRPADGIVPGNNAVAAIGPAAGAASSQKTSDTTSRKKTKGDNGKPVNRKPAKGTNHKPAKPIGAESNGSAPATTSNDMNDKAPANKE